MTHVAASPLLQERRRNISRRRRARYNAAHARRRRFRRANSGACRGRRRRVGRASRAHRPGHHAAHPARLRRASTGRRKAATSSSATSPPMSKPISAAHRAARRPHSSRARPSIGIRWSPGPAKRTTRRSPSSPASSPPTSIPRFAHDARRPRRGAGRFPTHRARPGRGLVRLRPDRAARCSTSGIDAEAAFPAAALDSSGASKTWGEDAEARAKLDSQRAGFASLTRFIAALS